MCGLVGGCPDVDQGHGGVEPVEDADGESHVAQDCPHVRTIEIYLDGLVVVALSKIMK